MTASCVTKDGVVTATCGHDLDWNLLLALPSASLSTKKARALLPERYSREDAVANIQATALLVAAFAQNRGYLLHTAMRDRLHQPYRAKACPLLQLLLPLTGSDNVLGVALSGAGPSVLLITANPAPSALDDAIRRAVNDPTVEVIHTTISRGVVKV